MAELLDVNPTRGALLKLEGDLANVRRHFTVLDRKRETLVRELMDRLDSARELEAQRERCFERAHRAIQRARMRMGSDRIEWICLSPAARVSVRTAGSSVMGLRIPRIELDVHPVSPPYGMADTSAALDEARECWIDVLNFLSDASEIFTSVWRLAVELRKTQRQVNALESTIIPRYERTISHVEDVLEEEEREDIVRAKKTKERREASNGPGRS
jgi:V/A-type H+-transporting ATPase subunit D